MVVTFSAREKKIFKIPVNFVKFIVAVSGSRSGKQCFGSGYETLVVSKYESGFEALV